MKDFDEEDVGDVHEDTARRLRQTRLAMLYEDQDDFAADAKLGQSHYTRFEGGKRRISLGAALKLAKHHGLSLDWIYFGDSSGVHPRTWNRIKFLRKDALWRDDKKAIALLRKYVDEEEFDEPKDRRSVGKRRG